MVQQSYAGAPSSERGARLATNPGATLSASQALADGQELFDRAQVAYFIDLAYATGRRHTMAENIVETIATWDERTADAGRCTVTRPRFKAVRDQRKAARMAEYERLSGPARFHGGLPKPAPYVSAGNRVAPRFPRLEDQAAWLSAEDVAYLKRCARQAQVDQRARFREAA